MKNLTFLFFLQLIAINSLLCQNTYDLFSTPGLFYGIAYIDSYANFNIRNNSIFYQRDTIINNKRFLQFASTNNPLSKWHIYIEGYKVFAKENISDTKDLLYDFGAEPGDTVKTLTKIYKVLSKEVRQLNDGKDRIYMKLHHLSSPAFTVEWMEGIGDLRNSLIFLLYHHPFDVHLVCVNVGGQIIYQNDVENISCKSLNCIRSGSKFSYTHTGEELQFINQSEYYEEVEWDFGDGTTSTELHPTHRYETPGCKEVSLRTTSLCGTESVSKQKIDYCETGDWQTVANYEVQGGINQFHYINAKEIWASNIKSLYYSKDAGKTFEQIAFKADAIKTTDYIRSTAFKGDNGVIFFWTNKGNKRVYQIYITDDKGKTWKISKEFTDYSMGFINYGNTCMIVSYDPKSPAYISYNLGKLWFELKLPFPNGIRSLDYKDNVLVAVQRNPALGLTKNSASYSLDEGKTWNTQPLPPFIYMSVIDTDNVYLLTETFEILHVQDRFRSIKKIYQFQDLRYLNQMIFKDLNHGYLLTGEKIYFTSDGGKNWDEQNCLGENIRMLQTDHNNNFFALNDSNLLRYIPIGVKPECSTFYKDEGKEINPVNIFPNPVLSGEQFQVVNNTKGMLTIDIFDFTGRLVISSNVIDSNDIYCGTVLNSGNYIVRIFEEDTRKYFSKVITVL
ncbi:MAG: T9SS type A sorting domain-containing protein [Saprospiraceae bacterium]|nr:T9SS type A sorting domain-containing protein [Saprospiraceae bacterium]